LTLAGVLGTLTESMKDRWRRLALAVVAFAAVGALSFESYLPHTDDGCAVETHCAVCAAHLGTAAVRDVHAPAVARLQVVGVVLPDAVTTALDPPVPASSSRGPPLA
jgi:hypothetical protein